MGFFKNLFGGGEGKASALDAVYAPVAGEAVPISEVSDPTFGEEIWGKALPSARLRVRCLPPATPRWT